MENSLLSKLPPELRLEIYSYVFEGAEVVIYTLQQSYAYPLGIFRCSEHASLIKTCRDLRNEALPVLFTKAVVVAKGSGKYMTLSKLNEVIGDHAAQHISHIRNIRLPKRRASSAPILRSTMGLLGKYPKLKTCGIWVGSEHFTETEWSSSIITQHVSIELDARPLCFGPKRSPRSFCSHEETITAPKSILKNVYGIDEACKVHFVRSCQLMRRSWNRVDRDVEEYNLEPMDDCQTPSLAPVGWFNYTTGTCWLDEAPAYPHILTREAIENAFREVSKDSTLDSSLDWGEPPNFGREKPRAIFTVIRSGQ